MDCCSKERQPARLTTVATGKPCTRVSTPLHCTVPYLSRIEAEPFFSAPSSPLNIVDAFTVVVFAGASCLLPLANK